MICQTGVFFGSTGADFKKYYSGLKSLEAHT